MWFCFCLCCVCSCNNVCVAWVNPRGRNHYKPTTEWEERLQVSILEVNRMHVSRKEIRQKHLTSVHTETLHLIHFTFLKKPVSFQSVTSIVSVYFLTNCESYSTAIMAICFCLTHSKRSFKNVFIDCYWNQQLFREVEMSTHISNLIWSCSILH